MKKQTQRFTDEEILKNEKPITAGELLAEIKPLLDDYFVGDISFDGSAVTYTLPNGQKFILSAKEVA